MKQDLPLEATVLVCQALVPHLLPLLSEIIIFVTQAVPHATPAIDFTMKIHYGMALDAVLSLPRASQSMIVRHSHLTHPTVVG